MISVEGMGFCIAPGAMISMQVDINHNKWVSVNPGVMKVTEGQAMKLNGVEARYPTILSGVN